MNKSTELPNHTKLELAQEIEDRKTALIQELMHELAYSNGRARLANWLSILMLLSAIACSFGAGIAGLVGLLPQKALGAISFIPGAIAIAASQFRLRNRIAWHHRRRAEIKYLLGELQYRMPLEPSLTDIAAISKARDDLNKKMQSEWDRDVTLDWTDGKARRTISGSR